MGNPASVIVEFPLESWSFTASFRPAAKKCGRVQDVPLVDLGEGRYLLRPAGSADTYDFTLVGRGRAASSPPSVGRRPATGSCPPRRRAWRVLAGHDGRPDSYGVELELTNLVRTPKHASARITVRAADGAALTFAAERSRARCLPEGTVNWDGPDDRGMAAAGLGDGPFTYEVELALDGAHYAGTAR